MKKITVEAANENPYVVFSNDDLAIIHSMRDFDDKDADKLLLDGFVLILLRKGHVNIQIDNENFDIGEGCLFACRPRNIIENVVMSVDTEASGIFCTPKFALWILSEANIDISEVMLTRNHNIAVLSQEEQDIFIEHIGLIGKCLLAGKNKPHTSKTLLALFTSLAWQIIDASSDYYMMIKELNYSSQEMIFQRFIKMLAIGKAPVHDVQGYAKLLHISPKYFSYICKRVAGRNASSIISEYIVKESKNRLRNPRLSIKEISSSLGFTNPSHFGTYLRKKTGKCPQELRGDFDLSN